jgi:hypothetical protein
LTFASVKKSLFHSIAGSVTAPAWFFFVLFVSFVVRIGMRIGCVVAWRLGVKT